MDEPINLNQNKLNLPPIRIGSGGFNGKGWSPSVLVLGPGGMKGFLELGALSKLEEDGILQNINTYFGVSVGSVICLLRIIGYSYSEIAELGVTLNLFNGWDDIDFSKIIKQNGIISHDNLRTYLSKIVMKKLEIIPTFRQLYSITNTVLRIVTYNLTDKTTYYFDHRTHPDTSVIEGVLASCTIPLLFYKFKYRGCYYCDGAIGNPYPVNMVDDGLTDILGIYIESSGSNNQDNLQWYLDRVIYATMTEYRKQIIQNSSARCKHLPLISDVKDMTGLAVNNKLRIEMFRSGYSAASDFLNPQTIIMEPRANQPIPYVPIDKRRRSIRMYRTLEKIISTRNRSRQRSRSLRHRLTDSWLDILIHPRNIISLTN